MTENIDTQFVSKVAVWKFNAENPEFDESIVIDVIDADFEDNNIIEISFKIKDKDYSLRFNKERFDDVVNAMSES